MANTKSIPKTRSKALWVTAFPEQATPPKIVKVKYWNMSAKRKVESKIYKELRDKFLFNNQICQRCGAAAQCVHHWAGRRSNYLKVETWRASCLACNDFAKQHPAEARAGKWLAPVGIYLT